MTMDNFNGVSVDFHNSNGMNLDGYSPSPSSPYPFSTSHKDKFLWTEEMKDAFADLYSRYWKEGKRKKKAIFQFITDDLQQTYPDVTLTRVRNLDTETYRRWKIYHCIRNQPECGGLTDQKYLKISDTTWDHWSKQRSKRKYLFFKRSCVKTYEIFDGIYKYKDKESLQLSAKDQNNNTLVIPSNNYDEKNAYNHQNKRQQVDERSTPQIDASANGILSPSLHNNEDNYNYNSVILMKEEYKFNLELKEEMAIYLSPLLIESLITDDECDRLFSMDTKILCKFVASLKSMSKFRPIDKIGNFAKYYCSTIDYSAISHDHDQF